MAEQGMKQRADAVLAARGFYESRARARAAIEAGLVEIAGRRIAKPSEPVDPDAQVTRADQPHPWVSRGGLKLAAALDAFGFDPQGRVCLDTGASTGGFTDVLLTRGAKRVVAVDVGHGQLHPRIAGDPRVVSLEGRDARTLDLAATGGPVEAIVCDVSFISLALVLPHVLGLAAQGAWLAALIKPQFEAGRENVTKGLVKDERIRDDVCERIRKLVEDQGWRVVGLIPSPIEGGDGNVEYLIGAERG